VSCPALALPLGRRLPPLGRGPSARRGLHGGLVVVGDTPVVPAGAERCPVRPPHRWRQTPVPVLPGPRLRGAAGVRGRTRGLVGGQGQTPYRTRPGMDPDRQLPQALPAPARRVNHGPTACVQSRHISTGPLFPEASIDPPSRVSDTAVTPCRGPRRIAAGA